MKKETPKADQIEELYKQVPFDHIQRPIRLGRGVVLASILLAIVFGIIAGFGGGLFVLITRSLPIPFFGQFNLDEYLPRREITIKTEEKVTVTPDERIASLAKDARGQKVTIFEAKSPALEARFLDQIYLEKEALGLGGILTSDGWIITSDKTIGSRESKSLVLVDYNRKVYPVQERVVDPASGIIFLKIDASRLPVIKLAEAEDVTQGQEVFVFNRKGGIIRSVVSELDWQKIEIPQDLVQSSDKFSQFITLSIFGGETSEYVGSPVINLEGSVVGIVSNYQLPVTSYQLPVVIPTSQFKDIINQVLRNKKISRAYLGIDYIGLSQIIGITDPGLKDLKTGALVYGPPKEDSPAEEAGLKNRDVILRVNDDPVDLYHNLSALIQEYSPGDEIELTILREGKQEVVKVGLGELIE